MTARKAQPMNRSLVAFLAAALCMCNSAFALQSPTQSRPTLPPDTTPPQGEKMDKINSAVVAARAATKEKRYADAEALMLPITSSRPELVIPWMELGLAQLGLKQYDDAEKSFKIALGTDSKAQERSHSDDFYQSPSDPHAVAPNATRQSRNTMGGTATTGQDRPPAVLGAAYAGLGEIYIHQGKAVEAQSAFNTAVQSNPEQAPLYLSNEAIFFFQAGNADAQLAAAEKAIAVDPKRAMLYYFKGQALTSKATIDPQTQKLVLPPGCVEAYHRYLELDPTGQFSVDAKGVLAAAAPEKSR
jgi:tetratricopeptide (TPR) repeat protein